MRQILTILAIQICLTSYGQINIKEIDKSLSKIDEKLYASKYEVSNKLYTNFLNSLRKANKNDQLAIARIDSLKWLNEGSYNKPFVYHYHLHPAYLNYPVVNITYDAAMLFCEWLSDEYNSNPKRKFKKVLLRLPTEKEWIKAAQGGDTTAIYPWKGTELKNNKGMYLCNYKRVVAAKTGVTSSNLNNAFNIVSSIESYNPNKLGLYNMSGNVAEMLIDKTIVKGGSFNDTEEFMRIDSKNNYDGSAAPSVGFRYFVEIIEK